MTVVNPKSISGINSITTGSGSDNLLTIHTSDASNTERFRIDSTGATKIVTGIVTTLTATTGIVTTLTANTVTSLGAVSGTTGTFSGAVSGTTGTFTGDVDIADKIVHTGDTDTAIRFSGADTITAETGGSERIRLTSTGLFGIGITPTAKLHVNGVTGTDIIAARAADSNGNSIINIISEGTTGNSRINFSDTAGIDGQISYSHNNRYLHFSAGGATPQVYLDSSGRLLIGNTDGATYADSSNDDLIIGSSANGKNDGITILSGTGQNGTLAFADSGGAYQGLVGYVHNGDYLRFHAGNTLKARIDTDGLKFNSDTAAANALDDYEEGTWTPGNNDMGVTVYYARYTKIGRLVHIVADVEFASTPADTSQVGYLTGLPFTNGDKSVHQHLPWFGTSTANDNQFFNTYFTPLIFANDDKFSFLNSNSGTYLPRSQLASKKVRLNSSYYTSY